MFNNCNSLNSLDVSNWDTSSVENMGYMFRGCKNLTALDVSKWDTSNVTSMRCIFAGCNNLFSLNLDNFKLDNVTDAYYMFENCYNLTTEIMISNLNITNYTRMFYHAASVAPAEIILDYTNETESLVDAMVETKVLETSNVHKKDKVAPLLGKGSTMTYDVRKNVTETYTNEIVSGTTTATPIRKSSTPRQSRSWQICRRRVWMPP